VSLGIDLSLLVWCGPLEYGITTSGGEEKRESRRRWRTKKTDLSGAIRILSFSNVTDADGESAYQMTYKFNKD
jgi:hypothetical protein